MELDKFWAWVREGGWLNLAAGAISVVVLAGLVWLAWPQIKPKPKPQQQSLSTIQGSAEDTSTQGARESVPDDVINMIAQDLGETPETVAVHWVDGKEGEEVLVRRQQAALQWEELTFVKRDGSWVRK